MNTFQGHVYWSNFHFESFTGLVQGSLNINPDFYDFFIHDFLRKEKYLVICSRGLEFEKKVYDLLSPSQQKVHLFEGGLLLKLRLVEGLLIKCKIRLDVSPVNRPVSEARTKMGMETYMRKLNKEEIEIVGTQATFGVRQTT